MFYYATSCSIFPFGLIIAIIPKQFHKCVYFQPYHRYKIDPPGKKRKLSLLLNTCISTSGNKMGLIPLNIGTLQRDEKKSKLCTSYIYVYYITPRCQAYINWLFVKGNQSPRVILYPQYCRLVLRVLQSLQLNYYK